MYSHALEKAAKAQQCHCCVVAAVVSVYLRNVQHVRLMLSIVMSPRCTSFHNVRSLWILVVLYGTFTPHSSLEAH